jgi:hypothetical protein
MTPDEDELLRSLRALPALDPPQELVLRVRRQARAELATASTGGWQAFAMRAWTMVGLPAALVATVVAYLSWAVTAASALYH